MTPAPSGARRRRWVLLLAALGLVGLLIDLGPVSLGALWWLMAVLMPGRTRVRQLAYATILLFALTAAVLTVLSVLNIRCSPPLLVGALLCALCGLLTGPFPPTHRPWADSQDLWALLLASVTLGLLLPPFLHRTPGQVMLLLSQSTDGADHVQHVLATARHGGYVNLHPVAGMREGLELYPSGWAGNVWVISRVANGAVLKPVETVRFVGAVAIASYALLVFLSARLSLALVHSIYPSINQRRQALITALVGLSTTVGSGLFLLNLASYTQIVAVIALLSAVLVLYEEASAGLTHLVLGAAAITLAQTWYLLMPIMAVVLLVGLLHLPRWRSALAGYAALVGPIVAYPLLTGPHIGQLDAGGSQLRPTLLGCAGVLASTAIALMQLFHKRGVAHVSGRAWAAALVACLFMEGGLLAGQADLSVGPSYYASKVLLVLLLIGGVGAAAGIGVAGRARLLTSSLLITGLGMSVWSTRDFALPPRAAHMEGLLDPAELDTVLAHYPSGFPNDTDVWIVDGCNRELDLIESRWVYDMSLTWTRARSDALQSYAETGVEMIVKRAADPDVRSIELVASHACQPGELTKLIELPKVTLSHVG